MNSILFHYIDRMVLCVCWIIWKKHVLDTVTSFIFTRRVVQYTLTMCVCIYRQWAIQSTIEVIFRLLSNKNWTTIYVKYNIGMWFWNYIYIVYFSPECRTWLYEYKCVSKSFRTIFRFPFVFQTGETDEQTFFFLNETHVCLCLRIYICM